MQKKKNNKFKSFINKHLEILITIVLCVVNFLFLLISGNFALFAIMFEIISFFGLYIFYLFRFVKRYISLKCILLFLIFGLLEFVIIVLIFNLDFNNLFIYNGLTLIFASLIYFVIYLCFVLIFGFTNLFKYLISKLRD